MSTHKTILQGAKHLRVPENVAEHPIIIGHEFCAEVVEVGDKWKDKFAVGDKVVMPPILTYLGGPETVGYSFEDIGGVFTYSIVYEHILDNDFLIKLNSDSYFKGSLIEPASCVISVPDTLNCHYIDDSIDGLLLLALTMNTIEKES